MLSCLSKSRTRLEDEEVSTKETRLPDLEGVVLKMADWTCLQVNAQPPPWCRTFAIVYITIMNFKHSERLACHVK